MGMIKCFRCGGLLYDRALRCPHCGAPSVNQNYPPSGGVAKNPKQSGNGSSGKGMIAMIVCIVILLIVVVGLLLYIVMDRPVDSRVSLVSDSEGQVYESRDNEDDVSAPDYTDNYQSDSDIEKPREFPLVMDRSGNTRKGFAAANEKWASIRAEEVAAGGETRMIRGAFLREDSIGVIHRDPFSMDVVFRPNGQIVGRYHAEWTEQDVNGRVSGDGCRLSITLGHVEGVNLSKMELSGDGKNFEGTWGKERKPIEARIERR